MSDQIRIEGLQIYASVGIHPHEAEVKQPLVFHIAMTTDIVRAAETDDVSDTVDYDHVVLLVREIVGAKHHNLIESIAERVASAILRQFGRRLDRVRVRVEKPTAVQDATVAVEIVRVRGMRSIPPPGMR